MMSALAMILAAGILTADGVPAPNGRAAQEQVIPLGRWVEKDDGSVWEFRKRGELRTSYPDGRKDFSSRYVLRPTTNPPQIDIITIDGTALGIYRLKGHRLEICWACPGTGRPTKFKPGKGDDDAMALFTFKRAK